MSDDLTDVRFLTVAEVADMMRVSKMTVYRMVHSGELPAIRFGRSFRVPDSAVAAVLRGGIADVGNVDDADAARVLNQLDRARAVDDRCRGAGITRAGRGDGPAVGDRPNGRAGIDLNADRAVIRIAAAGGAEALAFQVGGLLLLVELLDSSLVFFLLLVVSAD